MTILGIDPGSENAGIVILVDEKLKSAKNIKNDDLFTLIDEFTLFDQKPDFLIVYEDIRPYTSRFNMETINTCKVLGRLEYVLSQRRIKNSAITRNEVKSFIFKKYFLHIVEAIVTKIEKKKRTKKDGSALKPSFQYVDDRIVQRAMRLQWNIPIPKPGKSNLYGIKTHSWQALGAVTAFLAKEEELTSGVFGRQEPYQD